MSKEMTLKALKAVIKRCTDNKDYKTARNYAIQYENMKDFDKEKALEQIKKAENPAKKRKQQITIKEE